MIGLLMEGGSMRAGFVAGPLTAFMDKGLIAFDAAVAVSASVPTLAYFAAGQREEMERVWRKACIAVPGCYPAAVCRNGGEYIDGGTVNLLPVEAPWL